MTVSPTQTNSGSINYPMMVVRRVASFDIVLKTRSSLHPNGEPSEFVSEYTGIITCTDNSTGVVSKVGKVGALRVHAARLEKINRMVMSP